ncbi:MAG: cell division protein ZipA C-terminal FtsZ-binding domain-containing protein [Burkholderiales bacterium]
MSDLQLGLAILGLFVVAGVGAFNWWQERQFRSRAQHSLQQPQEDVLLRTEPAAEDSTAGRPQTRIEPQLDSAIATPALGAPVEGPDPALDYIAEIRAGEVIPTTAISELTKSLAQAGRRVVLAGYDYHAKTWVPVTEGDHWFTSLRAGLQLVDRSGAASLEQVQAFQNLIRRHAERMSAIADVPDAEAAVARAAELDEFCSDVDVVVGINVIAHTGQTFHGTQVRTLAEANGLRLQANGVFVYPDDDGGALFTLDNQEARPFRIEQIRHIATPGITFVLDVPRIRDGLRVFDRMVAMSRLFADSLDGLLADDNRKLLSDTGLNQIRVQLRGIYAAMEARGLPAGSRSALRLFA